jgi:glutaconate CoA-transferase subunit A
MESDASLLFGGYMATIEGLQAHPISAIKGTNLVNQTDILTRCTTKNGEETLAVLNINPDVAVIHVPQADEYGNARHLSDPIFDTVIARAARKVIITTDEVISLRSTENDPWKTTIPCYMVDAVVEIPFGAHPCACPPFYFYDEEHLQQYLTSAKLAISGEQPEAFSEYLKKYIYQPESVYDYLELIGGVKKIIGLKKGNRR